MRIQLLAMYDVGTEEGNEALAGDGFAWDVVHSEGPHYCNPRRIREAGDLHWVGGVNSRHGMSK